jgi:hypothetical protein
LVEERRPSSPSLLFLYDNNTAAASAGQHALTCIPLDLHADSDLKQMNTANSKPTRRRKSKYSSRRPKQKPKADDQPYYAVKNIIGEKLEKGQLWYRVDWEDDPHTNQRFDPTWVCAYAQACLSRQPADYLVLRNLPRT